MALSMRSALGSVFSRQRARFQSERIDPEGEDDRSPAVTSDQENDLTLVHDDTTAASSTVRRPTAIMVADDDDEGEAQRHQEQRRHESFGSEEIPDIENQSLRSDEGGEEEDDDDNPMMVETIPAASAQQQQQPTIVSLAELEEERELARRRSSACVLLAVFVLFRLWVEAIQDADFGLLLLCLVGTSWTARWIRHLRDREEELDRRIAAYSSAAANVAANGERNGEGTGGLVDRNELRMLSFQAQLALAIMESQRQMMQGGYGHPDGTDGASSSGVSDDARARWKTVPFTSALMGGGDKQEGSGGYGSLVADGGGKNSNNAAGLGQDAPHCSICLSEYEEGEGLIQLPCGHYYHEECINSWTLNHVKCPLCNFDLESAAATASTSGTTEASSS